MKGQIVTSKHGTTYYKYYQKTKRVWKGREAISKSGRHYRIYYQRKHPDWPSGMTPHSRINLDRCLKRDNYTCQICGSTLNLDVHHKDNGGPHIKGNETDNSLSNLVTLCHRCHLKLHYNVLGKAGYIRELRGKGLTLATIGRKLGVSRQRIHQVIKANSKENA